jgi:NAD(P)-dependent dehydrogenase (short-subunit alcohol dehydrogenase family)
VADKLDGKRVVLIGGTSGIGFAVAEAAKEAGAKVVVASSQQAKVDAAIKRLGAGAEGWTVDTGDEANVEQFFGKVGAFDHLVYTAGDWDGRPTDQWDLESNQWIFRIRFWGALRAIKYARANISKDGSITLTDGAAGRRPRRGAAITAAGAMAIEHLVPGLAVDLAPVRVNCVCPGIILTEAVRIPEDTLRRMTERQPIPRGGTPAECAEAYLYFMRGSYTTGHVLVVDGGLTVGESSPPVPRPQQ